MNDHISKPVDPKRLFAALLRWLPQQLPDTPVQNPSPADVAIASGAPLDDTRLRAQLAALPDLDVDFGLQAVRGRLASYSRLLGKFAGNHQGDFALIRQELAAGNYQEARRLAHSLKGAASTLGANTVRQAAATLEAAIRDALDAAAIAPLIDECATCYNRLSAALARILPTPAHSGSEMPIPTANRDMLKLLSRLRQQLRNGDFGVQALVAEQTLPLKQMLAQNYASFDTAISNFDFESALALLDTIVWNTGSNESG